MGRAPCCDKANVKKGPWSPEEDAKLKFFIEQNGTIGNWITLPSKAGLKRCGKSCRLRWINYLRPDIKRGSFSEDEEKTIYRLHGQIGSRWSLIAAQLPGRIDNDIKNYWNTRLKKKLSERSNASHAQYGRLLLEQVPANKFHYNQICLQGLEDQMAAAAAREGLLHGQHSYSINHVQHSYSISHLYPQQMQDIEHHHQVVQDPNLTVQLPTVMQHQDQMLTQLVPHIPNEMRHEMGHERRQQQATNEASDEAERLMFIESSFRSIIEHGEQHGGTTSLLATPRFDELFGDGRHPNLGVYHRSPGLSESGVQHQHQMLTQLVTHIPNEMRHEMGHERRQQQATNEASDEAERLMFIESSFRSIIEHGEQHGGTTSLLATPRFDELFGDGRHPNLGVYHRSPGLSESGVQHQHQMLTQLQLVPHIPNEMRHEMRHERRQQQATNEASDEAERLMFIESSFRSIIEHGEQHGGTTSLLATPRFDELFGDGRHPNLGVYHRSPGLSESGARWIRRD